MLSFVVDQNQMIEIGVKCVPFAAQPRVLGGRFCIHLFDEHLIAQTLRRSDVLVRFSKSYGEPACIYPQGHCSYQVERTDNDRPRLG